MMRLFLKAKHWQLFLLSVGVPMLLQVLIVQSTFHSVMESNGTRATDLFAPMNLYILLVLSLIYTLFGWYYSVGVGLHRRIPEHLRLNVGLFKVLLLIPTAYITVVCLYTGPALRGSMATGEGLNMGLLGALLLLHVFSMFCIFYAMYFVAKAYKTAELQRKVSFSDYIGEFFLVWFYPVGVWVLQPRVNELSEADYPDEMSDLV